MAYVNTRSALSHAGPTVHSNHSSNNMAYQTTTAQSEAPSLPGLPMELIQKIFNECSDITSVVNLSATSKKLRSAYLGSQKLLIIENVLENQFGPLYDAVQVITYNESQPAHAPREPAMSMALSNQITRIGYTAQKWELIYPMIRWRDQTEHRRVLRAHEAYRFRRALYRLWLYGKAFHCDNYLDQDPGIPLACTRDRRLTFMRRYNDDEMMEVLELNDIFHSMINNDLCPSDAMIQLRYSQGFPGQAPLYFGTYHAHPNHCYDNCFCRTLVLGRDLPQSFVAEAWGPWAAQDRTVRNVLKLEPDQLLYFREQLSNKAERTAYLRTLSDTFHRHSSTLRVAVESVMSERDYWIGPDHGIDGGILDWIDEPPGGRYESSDFAFDYRGSSTSGDMEDEDSIDSNSGTSDDEDFENDSRFDEGKIDESEVADSGKTIGNA